MFDLIPPFLLFLVVIVVVAKTIKIVPQAQVLVVERLGRFYAVLQPGLNIVIPFIDKIAYKHWLKEVPLDVPSQICITKDNTQLTVDGILYYQITDPKQASYGTSNYILAISQLAQTTLRSVIGKLELDKTFEERDKINGDVVAALDQAATSWGVKVLRYEIKDLTPPEAILHAMQRQITAEREKRALIAQSEGEKQAAINKSQGAQEAAINQSEGEKKAAINNSEGQQTAAVNRAKGEAEAIELVANATAKAIKAIADVATSNGGAKAIELKVAQQYIEAFSQIAKESTTLLLPGNLADVAGMVATALSVVKGGQAPGMAPATTIGSGAA